MNEQREIVYEYRDEVLEGRDMGDSRARARSPRSSSALVDEYTRRRLRRGLGPRRACASQLDADLPRRTSAPTTSTATAIDRDELKSSCSPRTRCALYDEREEELGEELMRALERYLLLQIIDQRWREHLYDMDYLREGIHLRGFAQIEPLVAYKNEAFTLFADLMNTDLGRLRADDLQRRGRGRRRPEQPQPPVAAAVPLQRIVDRRRRARLLLVGGAPVGASAITAAAARRGRRAGTGRRGFAAGARRRHVDGHRAEPDDERGLMQE